jgi:hypothetical protein
VEAWSSGDVGECLDDFTAGRSRSWSSWLDEDMFLERLEGWVWPEVGLDRRALLDLRGWAVSEGAGGGGSSWDCLRLRDEDEAVAAEGGGGRDELVDIVAAVGSVVGLAGAASLAEERVTLGGMSGRSTLGLVSWTAGGRMREMGQVKQKLW